LLAFSFSFKSIYTIVKEWLKKTPPSQFGLPGPKHLSIGHVIFTEDYLLQLARTSGFARRTPRKIDACSLLASICEQCLKGSPSCNDLAARIEASQGCGPSRQAVNLRLNESFEIFLQCLLENVIGQKLSGGNAPPEASGNQFRGYQRVLVQDSTIIKLPGHLFPEFSGVSNGESSVCNARIQATYDLLGSRLVSFSIDPYSKNDQTAAPELPIRAGDLVLRDRGYLVLDEIQRHLDAGADCIYRHRTGAIYLDPKTLDPIDLPALLKTRGRLDIDVRLNNASRTPVRLVAAPVDEETANLRRMKAKKEIRGHNPSKSILELMDWTIFITTVPAALAAFEQILAIYGLRWRIEIIFKAWKSHMSFHLLHRVSKRQMTIMLKARLLLIACCANILYSTLEASVRRIYRRRLSLLKFMNYLSINPANFVRALRSLSMSETEARSFHEALVRYCCYDKRKRWNYSDVWGALA
jgi:hypothetical protein